MKATISTANHPFGGQKASQNQIPLEKKSEK